MSRHLVIVLFRLQLQHNARRRSDKVQSLTARFDTDQLLAVRMRQSVLPLGDGFWR